MKCRYCKKIIWFWQERTIGRNKAHSDCIPQRPMIEKSEAEKELERLQLLHCQQIMEEYLMDQGKNWGTIKRGKTVIKGRGE